MRKALLALVALLTLFGTGVLQAEKVEYKIGTSTPAYDSTATQIDLSIGQGGSTHDDITLDGHYSKSGDWLVFTADSYVRITPLNGVVIKSVILASSDDNDTQTFLEKAPAQGSIRQQDAKSVIWEGESSDPVVLTAGGYGYVKYIVVEFEKEEEKPVGPDQVVVLQSATKSSTYANYYYKGDAEELNWVYNEYAPIQYDNERITFSYTNTTANSRQGYYLSAASIGTLTVKAEDGYKIRSVKVAGTPQLTTITCENSKVNGEKTTDATNGNYYTFTGNFGQEAVFKIPEYQMVLYVEVTYYDDLTIPHAPRLPIINNTTKEYKAGEKIEISPKDEGDEVWYSLSSGDEDNWQIYTVKSVFEDLDGEFTLKAKTVKDGLESDVVSIPVFVTTNMAIPEGFCVHFKEGTNSYYLYTSPYTTYTTEEGVMSYSDDKGANVQFTNMPANVTVGTGVDFKSDNVLTITPAPNTELVRVLFNTQGYGGYFPYLNCNNGVLQYITGYKAEWIGQSKEPVVISAGAYNPLKIYDIEVQYRSLDVVEEDAIAPTFVTESGDVYIDSNIEIACEQATAMIQYSFNNEDWMTYGSPILLDTIGEYTIYARTKSGSNYSEVITAKYNVIYEPVAAPTVSIENGSYDPVQTVTMTSAEGTTLKYQLNDGEWLVYTKPLTFKEKGDYTLNVQAWKGKSFSEMTTREFAITHSYDDALFQCKDYDPTYYSYFYNTGDLNKTSWEKNAPVQLENEHLSVVCMNADGGVVNSNGAYINLSKDQMGRSNTITITPSADVLIKGVKFGTGGSEYMPNTSCDVEGVFTTPNEKVLQWTGESRTPVTFSFKDNAIIFYVIVSYYYGEEVIAEPDPNAEAFNITIGESKEAQIEAVPEGEQMTFKFNSNDGSPISLGYGSLYVKVNGKTIYDYGENYDLIDNSYLGGETYTLPAGQAYEVYVPTDKVNVGDVLTINVTSGYFYNDNPFTYTLTIGEKAEQPEAGAFDITIGESKDAKIESVPEGDEMTFTFNNNGNAFSLGTANLNVLINGKTVYAYVDNTLDDTSVREDNKCQFNDGEVYQVFVPTSDVKLGDVLTINVDAGYFDGADAFTYTLTIGEPVVRNEFEVVMEQKGLIKLDEIPEGFIKLNFINEDHDNYTCPSFSKAEWGANLFDGFVGKLNGEVYYTFTNGVANNFTHAVAEPEGKGSFDCNGDKYWMQIPTEGLKIGDRIELNFPDYYFRTYRNTEEFKVIIQFGESDVDDREPAIEWDSINKKYSYVDGAEITVTDTTPEGDIFYYDSEYFDGEITIEGDTDILNFRKEQYYYTGLYYGRYSLTGKLGTVTVTATRSDVENYKPVTFTLHVIGNPDFGLKVTTPNAGYDILEPGDFSWVNLKQTLTVVPSSYCVDRADFYYTINDGEEQFVDNDDYIITLPRTNGTYTLKLMVSQDIIDQNPDIEFTPSVFTLGHNVSGSEMDHTIDFSSTSTSHGSLPVSYSMEDVKWLTDERVAAENEYVTTGASFRMYVPFAQSIAIVRENGLMVNQNQMFRIGFADHSTTRRLTKIVITGDHIENIMIGKNTQATADPRYTGGYEKVGDIEISGNTLTWTYNPDETDLRDVEIWNGYTGGSHIAARRAAAAVETTPTMIKTVTFSTDVPTEVAGLEAADDADAIYFDLQGHQIENPAAGVYIRVAGGKASKVIVK